MTKKKKGNPQPTSSSNGTSSNSSSSANSGKKYSLPWCWYCDREFEDLRVLILHQKARHFKCSQCNKRMNSGSGLVIHLAQVHKLAEERIPNAIPGHDTPELEIYGMEGVPRVDLERHRAGLPPQPFKRPKFLESGGLLPLLAAQKASFGAISITSNDSAFAPSPLPAAIHPPAIVSPPAIISPPTILPPIIPPPIIPVPKVIPAPHASFPPSSLVDMPTLFASGESDQPRFLPVRPDPKTGKMLPAQRLVVLHPEVSLEELRSQQSRYRLAQ